MKTIRNILLLLGIVVCISTNVAFADDSHKIEYGTFKGIILNGEKLQIKQELFTMDGHIMIPLRDISESLKYNISWNGEKREVTVKGSRPNSGIVLIIDNNTLVANGEEIKLRIAPTIVNGVTYVTPSVIQAGFFADVFNGIDGEIEIITRDKINNYALRTLDNIEKTIYEKDKDGFLTGMARVNIPVLEDLRDDDCNLDNGIGKINKYFLDNFWLSDNELRSVLKSSHYEDFLATAYFDCEVIYDGSNVFVVSLPPYSLCPDGELYPTMQDTIMFDVKTGCEIKAEQILGENIYDMLMNAYKNNDKNLMEEIAWIKSCNDKYQYFGMTNMTDEDIVKKIAERCHRNWIYLWVSNKEGWISPEQAFNCGEIPDIAKPNLLNIQYYIFGGPKKFSIDLDNAIEYLNVSF